MCTKKPSPTNLVQKRLSQPLQFTALYRDLPLTIPLKLTQIVYNFDFHQNVDFSPIFSRLLAHTL